MLTELAARDWYEDRVRTFGDGRTAEERQAHGRQMQQQYRLIGEDLMTRLSGEVNAK
jgi:hypothetical protein